MTTKTATAEKPPKTDEKKSGTPSPAELPLKGSLINGQVDRLDGKGVLKSPPDPLCFERAKHHAKNLDELEDVKKRVQYSAGELIDAFGKSHKQRYVRIPGKHATYVFTMKNLGVKLGIEKQDKVK